MYTGNLIENLMKTVERNEERSMQAHSPEETLPYFYAVTQSELTQVDSRLLGAA